jgi:hypothetical protein
MPDIAPTTGMIPVFAVVVILFLTEKVRQTETYPTFLPRNEIRPRTVLPHAPCPVRFFNSRRSAALL